MEKCFLICYVFGNMAYMLFLRFALFKERRRSRKKEGFHNAFERKEGRVQIKTGRELN
jgi:hypothetical protein